MYVDMPVVYVAASADSGDRNATTITHMARPRVTVCRLAIQLVQTARHGCMSKMHFARSAEYQGRAHDQSSGLQVCGVASTVCKLSIELYWWPDTHNTQRKLSDVENSSCKLEFSFWGRWYGAVCRTHSSSSGGLLRTKREHRSSSRSWSGNNIVGLALVHQS